MTAKELCAIDGEELKENQLMFLQNRKGNKTMDVNERVELLNEFILVTQEAGETKSESGLLFIPEAAQEAKNVYHVKAVSPNVSVVKVGDKIIIDRWSANENTIDGVKYFVIEPSQILCRFKN